MSKIAEITATIPDLRGNCYATAKAEAHNAPAAIAKAVRHLFKQRHVHGKRIRSLRLTVTLTTPSDAQADQLLGE